MDTHYSPKEQSAALPYNEDAAINKLTCQHHSLLVQLVKKHRQAPLTFDECLGEAKVGLWKAFQQHGSDLLDDADQAARIVYTCVNSHLLDLKRSFFKFERLKARRSERNTSIERAEQEFTGDVCDGLGLTDRETLEANATPCTFSLRGEGLALVTEELRKLNTRQQSILHARYFVGMTLTEVASRLRVTPSAVHATEKRALQTLRGSLDSSLLELFCA
jgi:RNA polymerase sigma factor (sigma-70 family)